MTSELRILTVRQPWAWAIIHGGKDVENRVRNIAGDYRGPVAIHSGLLVDQAGLDDHRVRGAITLDTLVNDVFLTGNIIGVVDLVDVHDPTDMLFGHSPDHPTTCSLWAEPAAFHLVLENPRPLAEPIPFKGALGLRRMDEETTAAVWSQIGA